MAESTKATGVGGEVLAGDVVTGSRGRRWRVVRALGSGTCCCVYLVHSEGPPQQEAALKVYNSGAIYEAAHHREALLLDLTRRVRGQSPYLVEIEDNFVHQGHACLVQQRLEGSVRHLITKNRGHGLSLAVVQRLALQLLRGVQTLHNVGFVHGDLKPSNLLWNPQHACLSIIDFGISFHKDDKRIGRLQSLGYRAPEVERWNLSQFPSKTILPTTDIRTAEASPKVKSTYHFTSASLMQIPMSYTTPSTSVSSETPDADRSMKRLQLACQDGYSEYYGDDPGGIQNKKQKSEEQTFHERPLIIEGIKSGEYVQCNRQIEPVNIHYSSGTSDPQATDGCSMLQYGQDGKPGPASDMWGIACVIIEMVTGEKLFKADRLESPARQVGIVDTRKLISEILQDACVENSSKVKGQVWDDMKDLCCRFLAGDPDKRIAAEDAMRHPFFSHILVPAEADLLLLTSRVLRLVNVIPAGSSEQHIHDITSDLEEELVKYGKVRQMVAPCEGRGSGKVYVEYEKWEAAVAAFESMCHRTFDGHSILASYFPLEDYETHNFY